MLKIFVVRIIFLLILLGLSLLTFKSEYTIVRYINYVFLGLGGWTLMLISLQVIDFIFKLIIGTYLMKKTGYSAGDRPTQREHIIEMELRKRGLNGIELQQEKQKILKEMDEAGL